MVVTATVLALTAAAAVADTFELRFEAASGGSYAEPHDIVLSPDGSKLYVADNANHRIAVLDPVTLKELGNFGQGEVGSPHDVAFDNEGRLLVADTDNSRIAIYAVDGATGRLVDSLSGGIRRPEGVAVHADGRVFATGASSGNIVVFQNGKIAGQLDGFSSPHDVEFDPTGGIWVADANNNRIVRLNDALEIAATLSGAPYNFNGPRYLDFDVKGNMFVADKYANQIKIVAPDGRLLQVLGTAQAGKGPGVFDRPEGVEIRGNTVWFSDTYNNRIVRYGIVDDG